MSLLDVIVGKKKVVEDELLGSITSSRMKGEKPGDHYPWEAKYLMKNAILETVIILEGDSKTPNALHVKGISDIISDWPNLCIKIDTFVQKRVQKSKNKDRYKNWKNDFYLACISPLNNIEPNFEICLDPVNKDHSGYITFHFKDNEISDFDIKL